MPAPLTTPVLREDFCLLVSSSKGCHRTSWTLLLWERWLVCARSASPAWQPCEPSVLLWGAVWGPPGIPPQECRAGACKQAGTMPQPPEEMEGKPFSSITNIDIPSKSPLLAMANILPPQNYGGVHWFLARWKFLVSAWVEVIKPHSSLLRATRKGTELNKCCSLFFHKKCVQLGRGFSLFLKDVY